MPPSSRRTSTFRVVLALLFAWVFPSLVLGQAYFWQDPSITPKNPAVAIAFGAPSLVMGLFLGWPYVVGSAGCWAVLDHVDRHYAWTAALVGLAAGAGVAISGVKSREPVFVALSLSLSVVTGLGVWWIAYGRQGWLPEPAAPPKARLVL